MLTAENRKENAEKYVELLSMVGLDTEDFLKYLTSIQYFDAPYSAQCSGNYAGGLCEYALKLAHELGILCNAYFPGVYTSEDILKVALVKEIYRAVLYESYVKNVKNEETGQWEATVAFKTREDRPIYGDLGMSAYMIMKDFTSFTDEQIEAIVYSAATNISTSDNYKIYKKYPLVILTKMADLVITTFKENN